MRVLRKSESPPLQHWFKVQIVEENRQEVAEEEQVEEEADNPGEALGSRRVGGGGVAPVQAGRHLVGCGGSNRLLHLPRDRRRADKAAAKPPLKVKQRGDREAELMAAATLSDGRRDGWTDERTGVPVLMAAFNQESESCHLGLGQLHFSKRPAAT